MSHPFDAETTFIGTGARGGGGGPKVKVAKGNAAINAASRSGNVVDVSKKFHTGQSTGKGGEGQRQAKIANTEANLPTPGLSAPARAAIQQALNKGKKPKDLTEFSHGRIPTKDFLEWMKGNPSSAFYPKPWQVTTMEKFFGVKLTGKAVGTPLPTREESKAAAESSKK